MTRHDQARHRAEHGRAVKGREKLVSRREKIGKWSSKWQETHGKNTAPSNAIREI